VTDATGRCVWCDLPSGRRVVAARPLDGERGGADALAVDVHRARTGRRGAARDPAVRRDRRAGARAARPALSEMTVEVEGLSRKLEATTDVDGRRCADSRPAATSSPSCAAKTRRRATSASALAAREPGAADVEGVSRRPPAHDFSLDVD
jgi:hypothetical protein